MADQKHPIRNSIAATLGAAAITGIAVHFVPGGWASVFAAIAKTARACVSWFGSSVALPAWLVVLLAVLALIVVVAVLIIAFAALQKSPQQSAVAAVAEFTEADFFNVKWRWRYGQNGIWNITAYCPICDLQVHPQNASSYRAVDLIVFRCDDGHWESQPFECTYAELEDRVHRKIQQRLRNELERQKRKQV